MTSVSTDALWSPGVGSVLVVVALTAWWKLAPSAVPASTMVSTPLAPEAIGASVQRRVAPGVQVAGPSVRTKRAPDGMTSVTVTPAAALGPRLATVTSYDVSRSTTPKAGPVIVTAMSAWHGATCSDASAGQASWVSSPQPSESASGSMTPVTSSVPPLERLRHRSAPVARTPSWSPARMGRRTGRRWRSVGRRILGHERARRGKTAGATLAVVSVRSVQRTSTPSAGAVGEAEEASQHPTARCRRASGRRSAPNVTAARAPAGTSSSMHRRAAENRTAMAAL